MLMRAKFASFLQSHEIILPFSLMFFSHGYLCLLIASTQIGNWIIAAAKCIFFPKRTKQLRKLCAIFLKFEYTDIAVSISPICSGGLIGCLIETSHCTMC